MMYEVQNFLAMEHFGNWDVFQSFFVYDDKSSSIDVVKDEVISVVVEIVSLEKKEKI